jgi:hypothetical protein
MIVVNHFPLLEDRAAIASGRSVVNDVAAYPGSGALLGVVGVGPGGDTDGRGSVNDEVGGASGLDDGGVAEGHLQQGRCGS